MIRKCSSVLLLTVDNHIDVFDIRRGNIIAGLAFIATCLVSHDAYNVQVLLSIQWLCCKEKKRAKKNEKELLREMQGRGGQMRGEREGGMESR